MATTYFVPRLERGPKSLDGYLNNDLCYRRSITACHTSRCIRCWLVQFLLSTNMSVHAAQNMTCPPSAGGLETNLLSSAIPFYFAARKDLVAGIPDAVLSLVAHHIVYWALSVVFDILDHSGWKWLDRYRVHDPDGSKPHNLATRSQVVFSVVAQQVMQTGLGLTFLEEVPHISLFRCEKELEAVEGALLGFAQLRFIPNLLVSMLALHKSEIAYWLYWWIIPISQLILAM